MSENSAWRSFSPYLVAVGSIVGAIGLRLLMDPFLGIRFPFATLFFAVLVTAWYGGFAPAAVAVALGSILSIWFLLPPRHSWELGSVENHGGLALYLTVSLGIAIIGEAMRRARERAEAASLNALARAEQLRVTMQSIGDAVLTTDTQGRVTSLNPVAENLTGWTTAAAAGQPLDVVFQIVNEVTGERVANPVDMVLAKGQVVGLANHTVLIARDGSRRPIDDSAAPIRDHQGQLVGVVLVFRDVTERRSAEIALRRSEQDLVDFFENATVGLHIVGPDGKILRANKAELELLGYERDEFIGRHIAEFHDDSVAIQEILRRLEAGECIRQFPARMKCKNGAVKDVLVSSSALWEDGKLIHTRCFTLDITDRKRIEESHALLAAAVASSDDAIITKTLDGTITSWNAGAERLFGYSAEEAVGQHITLLIPPDRHDEEREILRRLRNGERIQHYDTVRMDRHGRMLDISLTTSPVRDSTGRIIGGSKVARDVSERKRNEQALRDSSEALRQADRRKDEFLATLAHELRNPLAPVRNALEIMKHAAGDAAIIEQARSTMDRQMAHLERLVDDLLDLSRITRDTLELRRQRLELASVVHQAVETCRPLAESQNHELTTTLPEEPIFLHADPVRLAQVFSNLLNNACKYTDPGGRIQLSARLEGQQVVVSVKDNGLGIAADMLPRIFQMFTQVDQSLERSQGGLGIGLTLVRRLVEMHGGEVEAKSMGPGHGSEFIVRLPVVSDALAAVTPAPHNGEPVAQGLRILVVDDNKDAAVTLATLLRLTGHEVNVAHDGETAVETARSELPQVVLMDIGLPKINGYEAARRIRAEPWGKNMLLIAATGWGQNEDRRKSEEAGFDHHLVKPVDLAALRAMLAKVASSSTS